MYDLKLSRSKDQTPSQFLMDNIKLIDILNKPIIDVACGYGRNGGYLVKDNNRVVFIDNDVDCLEYISSGKNISDYGDVDLNNVRVLHMDLNWAKLPFPNDSAGGIIDIHYYNPFLIKEMIRVLSIGGFFCFETISARGNNVYELPDYNLIKKLLKNFEIVSYSERQVKPFELGKSVVKIFAVKK